MRTRLLMTELLYLAPNRRYDRLMRDLNRADADTLNAVNNGSIAAMLRLFHLDDVELLRRFARERLPKLDVDLGPVRKLGLGR
jgi:digeranylgeranylglycerophospholipid reductase